MPCSLWHQFCVLEAPPNIPTKSQHWLEELDDFNIFNSSMNFWPFNTPSASTFYNFSWTGLDAKVRTQMGRKPLYSAVTPSSMRIRLKACTMPQTKWDWQQSTSQQNRCPLWQARSFKNAYSIDNGNTFHLWKWSSKYLMIVQQTYYSDVNCFLIPPHPLTLYRYHVYTYIDAYCMILVRTKHARCKENAWRIQGMNMSTLYKFATCIISTQSI